LIGLRITDYNHKDHEAHKGLAKVNQVPDNPKKTFGAGFVPFVSFVVYIRRRSVSIGLQITDFNHKVHKDHKGLRKG